MILSLIQIAQVEEKQWHNLTHFSKIYIQVFTHIKLLEKNPSIKGQPASWGKKKSHYEGNNLFRRFNGILRSETYKN